MTASNRLVEKWRTESARLRDLAKQALNEGRERWGDSAIEYAKAREVCADELESELAGGGEAVAMRFKLPGSSLWSYDTNITEIDRLVKYGWTVEFLFSHPSAVTDEMVKLATAAFFSSDECQPPLEHEYECMRAALTAALSPGGSRECG